MLDKVHPIIKSRRFISALIGIIVMMIVPLLPREWGIDEAQVTEYVLYIVITLVSAYGAQDVANALKGNVPASPPPPTPPSGTVVLPPIPAREVAKDKAA